MWLLPLAVGCAGEAMRVAPAAAHEEITPGALMRHVNFLADPKLAGRATGTPENARAAEYVAKQFADAGLTPAGDAGTWYQAFTASKLRLAAPSCRLAAGTREFAIGKDFAPMSAGRAGAFDAPLVFAGYGVHNRIRGYNDYAAVSARGAVVMILQGEPHDASGQSQWALKGHWTELAPTAAKLKRAAEEGAVAVLIVTPPTISPDIDSLEDVLGAGQGALPAVRISRQAADELLAPAGSGKTVAQLTDAIRATGKPASFAVGPKISGTVNLVEGAGRNVIGFLPAPPADPRAPVLLVGAHYDHLPTSGQKARDHGFGVRPGADDNACGTAGLILLARAMARVPQRHHAILFVAFSGEEFGFLGSKHFIRHPVVPLESIVTDVTLDQIGRVRNDEILLIGNVNYPPLSRAIRGARGALGRPRYSPIPVLEAHHWSDQAPFVAAGVRTLLVTNGLHADYHTMRDTADRVNAAGACDVTRMVLEILTRLASQPPQARETPPVPDEPMWHRMFPEDTPAAATQP